MTDDCPLCNRADDETREDAARRVEALAIAKPTAKNKRRARLGRACFEPFSERVSKIFFLTEALMDEGDIDMSLHFAPLGDPEPFLSASERARRMASDGVRVSPGPPWWVLENA